MRTLDTILLGTALLTACGDPDLGVSTAAASPPRDATSPDWTLHLGGDENDTVRELSVAPDGAVVIAGQFEGELVLGDATLTSAGETDAFIAVLEPDGDVRWAERVGGPGYDSAGGLAVNAGGEVTLVGDFTRTIELGPRTYAARGDSDAFAARYAGDGTPRWSAAFGGPGWQMVAAAAGTPAGGVAVVLTSGDAERAGDTVHATTADAVVALLDGAGKLVWTRRLAGAPWAQPHDVAVTEGGEVVVGGSFMERLRPPLHAALRAEGPADGFLARYSDRGELRWIRQIGGAGDDAVTALAARDSEIRFAGRAIDPERALSAATSGSSTLLVGRIDGTGDDLALSERRTGPATARSIVLLPGGAILIAGTGPPARNTIGFSDVVIALLDGDRDAREVLRVAGPYVSAAAAACSADGTTLFAAGSFVRRATTPTEKLEGRGGLDGFVLAVPVR